MRPFQKTFGSTAAVTTSLASSHSPGTGVAFTQQATSFTGGYAQLVTLTSTTATTNAGNAYTILGTDADGHLQTETIATGPAGSSTVTSTKYFKTVTSITGSGASTSIAAGNSALSASGTFICDYINPVASMGYGFTVSSGASLTYKLQHTYDDVFDASQSGSSAKTWFDDATTTGKTAAFNYSMTNAVRGSRIVLTVYTSGTVTGTLVQGINT
jgi:hypothetical protein